MLIAYATDHGSTASDIGDSSGPYASALAAELNKPGRPAGALFDAVKFRVYRETSRPKQLPWHISKFTRPIVLSTRDTAPPTTSKKRLSNVKAAPQKQIDREQAEIVFWTSVKDAKDPALLQAYLSQFPKGLYAPIARILLQKLQRSSEKATLARIKKEELRLAEAKKRQAEAARIDAERKRAMAKQHDALIRARQEAKRANEALKAAEKERLAALKTAQNARRAQESADRDASLTAERTVQQARKSRLASLAPSQSNPPQSSSLSNARLVREAQTQLKRLGCYAGLIDGQWGPASRAAAAKILGKEDSTSEPSRKMVDLLKRSGPEKCSIQAKGSETSGKADVPNSTVRSFNGVWLVRWTMTNCSQRTGSFYIEIVDSVIQGARGNPVSGKINRSGGFSFKYHSRRDVNYRGTIRSKRGNAKYESSKCDGIAKLIKLG